MPSYVEVLECLLVTVGVDNPVPPLEGAGTSGGTKKLVITSACYGVASR